MIFSVLHPCKPFKFYLIKKITHPELAELPEKELNKFNKKFFFSVFSGGSARNKFLAAALPHTAWDKPLPYAKLRFLMAYIKITACLRSYFFQFAA